MVALVIVMLTLTFSIFSVESINKVNKTYEARLEQNKTTYSILQIIKSDYDFYMHPEVYFTPGEFIEVGGTSTQVKLWLYFDEQNNLCPKGMHNSYLYFVVNVYTNTGYKRLYYSIYKYFKMDTSFVKYGELIYFAVYC